MPSIVAPGVSQLFVKLRHLGSVALAQASPPNGSGVHPRRRERSLRAAGTPGRVAPERASGATPCWAAFFRRRSSPGSESFVERTQEICSSAVRVRISSLIRSLIPRTISTQSKLFLPFLFTWQNLPWGTNFYHVKTTPKIHRIEPMYPLQVYDVFEVPACKHVHLCERSHRDVKRVCATALR